MSDALNIAARGLVESERRATDLAGRIVTGGADRADTGANAEAIAATFPGTVDAALGGEANNAVAATPNIAPLSDTLIRDIVGLQAAEASFAANAAAFRRISETEDALIGSVVDDES